MPKSITLLCLASYFKGEEFLRSAKREGCIVLLLTSKKHEDKDWPRESIDDIFYVQQNEDDDWTMKDVIQGLAWLMRSRKIDRIVSLDDFDVEKGAHLREEFRIPGMGQSTARHFRDKLAMRIEAQNAGIAVPPFCPLFNDEAINHYAATVPAPWLVKPRGEASATGIRKVRTAEELWRVIHELGNERHRYLVEQFRPGSVYHVDALTVGQQVVYARASEYLDTPMNVAHGGGIFRSLTMEHDSEDNLTLLKMNEEVIKAFGLHYSASHTEFIRCHEDGKFYFLETASRVGGANLAEMVEVATGLNMWREWAKIEAAVARGEDYVLPPASNDHAGIIISLSRYAYQDYRPFEREEFVWKISKEYHVGGIVRSKDRQQVISILDDYLQIIQRDYHATAPPRKKPSS